MEVLAYDPFPSAEWVARNGIRYVESAKALAAECHVVSLHIPLTRETHQGASRSHSKTRFTDVSDDAQSWPTFPDYGS